MLDQRVLLLSFALLIAVCPAAIAVADEDAKEKGPVALNPEKTVLIDREAGKILLKGAVVLDRGLLEMLVCNKGTKEHESIIAVDAKSKVIHGGLLALGAEPGSPVKYQPEFQPPTGQKLDIFISWEDSGGKPQRVDARKWVRTSTERFFMVKLDALPEGVEIPRESKLRFDDRNKELTWYGPMSDDDLQEELARSENESYRKLLKELQKKTVPEPLTADFVFAGSAIYIDKKTGERFYEAEGGDMICVANFPSAMIDVAEKSTASNEAGRLYEAWTERVPTIGTEVTVEIVPRKEPEKP